MDVDIHQNGLVIFGWFLGNRNFGEVCIFPLTFYGGRKKPTMCYHPVFRTDALLGDMPGPQ